MEIWNYDEWLNLSCGVNDDGDLFFGDDMSGYNLPDTPENRQRVLADFENRYYDG